MLLGLSAIFAFDLDRYLSLAYFQQQQATFTALYAEQPLTVALGFFVIYALGAALSVPGVGFLALAAGAIFGLLWGVVLVSFASSVGATLAFLSARFVLRDLIEARFGKRLLHINRGIAKDGAFYLFSLRIIPVLPFFIINLAMGLTQIKTRTYYWVSQIGMLGATVVYVNVGTQLARIDTAQDIFSPTLLGSLLLLGLFPLLARRALSRLRKSLRWLGRRSARPTAFDRELVVIGAGLTGLESACVEAGVRLTRVVPAPTAGGACLQPMPQRTGPDVELLQGAAKLLNPWTLHVALRAGGSRRLTARSIVFATGTQPVLPDLPGLEDVGCTDSDALWQSLAVPAPEHVPQRLLVLGSSPTGCELAQAFARRGAQVTLVEQATRLLAHEDEDVAARVFSSLLADGVQVLLQHQALRCARQGEEKTLQLEHAGGQRRIVFDQLVCALGRLALLPDHGLQALGMATSLRLPSNTCLQALCPHVYVASEAAAGTPLGGTAAQRSWGALLQVLLDENHPLRADEHLFACRIGTDPELARAGLTEQAAKEQGVSVALREFVLDAPDAPAGPQAQTWVKVLSVPDGKRVLGLSVLGPHATDVLRSRLLTLDPNPALEGAACTE